MLTRDTLFFLSIDTTHIRKFQERFFPLGAVANPHIKILHRRKSIPQTVLVRCIENTVRSWQPFKIHLAGVDKSNPDGWLYLSVRQGKEQIIALQEALCQCIKGQDRKHLCYPADPNVILGFFAHDQASRDAAYEEANSLRLSYRTVFDRITVTTFNSTSRKIVESQDFKLGLGP